MSELTIGDRVRIKSDAEDTGHLYPMRFKAFRDVRLCGCVIAIGDDRIDPHPVTVDFAENCLNPETMDFWWDELEIWEPSK